jgi:proteic killer suppression protein
VIISFANEATADIAAAIGSRLASKALPSQLHSIAYRKLALVNLATHLDQLGRPPSNHLESLKGDRQGQHFIRINAKYRICFVWKDPSASEVEIVDYH